MLNLFKTELTRNAEAFLYRYKNDYIKLKGLEFDLHFDICWKTIQSRVKLRIGSNKKAIKNQIANGDSTLEKLLINAINDSCKAEMISGENHSYRGVLNTYGIIYKGVWRYNLSRAVQLGLFDKEQIQDYINYIESLISDVG